MKKCIMCDNYQQLSKNKACSNCIEQVVYKLDEAMLTLETSRSNNKHKLLYTVYYDYRLEKFFIKFGKVNKFYIIKKDNFIVGHTCKFNKIINVKKSVWV